MTYDLIAFDLDGTLTEPSSGLIASFEYALTKMGLSYGTRESLVRYIGPPLYSEWRREYGLSEKETDLALVYFHEYYADRGWCDNRVYDGVHDMLRALRAAGKRIALATSKPERFATKILDLYGLTPYFDFVAGAISEKIRDKKHEVLAYVLDAFADIPRERCILVGDRKYDAEGAAVCGIDSLGVLYGHGSREEITGCGFTYFVEEVADISEFLLK